MRIVMAICALLLTIRVFSQKISGTVTNEDREAISYGSISIGKEKISTITDINGKYSLEIPNDTNKNENVIIEASGYESKKITVNQIIKNSDIKLSRKVNPIREINLTGQKTKQEIIGVKKRPMFTFSKMFDQNVPTIEQGQIFSIYNWTKLNSYSFHIIPSSRFKEITLKLNIYSVKDGLPYESLLNENIIFKTTTTGWQTIDLQEYKLIYTHLDKLAITLQLVESIPQDDIDFIFGISAKKTLSNDLLYHYQSQGNWETSMGSFISNIDVNYTKNKRD
ncbi:carboxypeptidase-like regulatory domain-containing protein [Chryseobacterium sp. c4a]|uniref:carboxypeptidase-like regulatory domain-containing protein n=1 Tax=Chryseobacterium sp. c4a TaxID=1573582 RepID=UPI00135C9DD6|nr:carboxypeptidase-like regulatory domain-containing protein [Chryseobacterium sp. c4a]